ncbi:hypothetical protein SHIRM173S_13324 [Streptomyces hirsutus]
MTIVKSRPYSPQGPIFGRKPFSYRSRPIFFSPMRRVRKPASSGTPRKTTTFRAICHIEMSRFSPLPRPSQPGSRSR